MEGVERVADLDVLGFCAQGIVGVDGNVFDADLTVQRVGIEKPEPTNGLDVGRLRHPLLSRSLSEK